MIQKIWLIGGTQESAQLARKLTQAQQPCVVTVTTETAARLYPQADSLTVQVGAFQPDQLPKFFKKEGITAILDASHPFATEISQMAIAAAARCQLSYLRYERPDLGDTTENSVDADNITHLDNLDTLLAGPYLTDHRVLLTLGYRCLPQFQPWQDRATLFARILPSPVALGTALTAGFTADRLIALRPPISTAMEIALWQQWQISLVVTKASGKPGGEYQKQLAAQQLGVKLIVVDRPSIAYPQQTSELNVALKFCRTALGHGASKTSTGRNIGA